VRVVRYDRFGGIDDLWIDDAPDPEPGVGQVVIRVEASCINPGSLSALHGAPYVPARDLAGTVVAVADGIDAGADNPEGVAVGDQVLGWVQDWAAHAELVALPAGQLVHDPRRVVLGRRGLAVRHADGRAGLGPGRRTDGG